MKTCVGIERWASFFSYTLNNSIWKTGWLIGFGWKESGGQRFLRTSEYREVPGRKW
jgi:hypothetical protein